MYLVAMGGKGLLSPQDVHILTSGAWDYVISDGKVGFAVVI